MVIEKKRTFRLSSRERKQLLLWGSILILAMLGLIYLITPASAGAPIPKQQTKEADQAKPVAAHWLPGDFVRA
jgi:hypothetical protein